MCFARFMCFLACFIGGPVELFFSFGDLEVFEFTVEIFDFKV